MLSFYTGLPSKNVFHGIMALIKSELKFLYSANGTPHRPARELSKRAEFLLVLMRLRLGLHKEDLQCRFQELSRLGYHLSMCFEAANALAKP